MLAPSTTAPLRRAAVVALALATLAAAAALSASPASASGGARWRQPVVRVYPARGVPPALLKPALLAWNASGARIHLILTARRSRADIVVHTPSRRARSASVGCHGYGGMTYRDNTAFTGGVTWTRCFDDPSSIYLLTHEIGHTIGLRHITRRCAVMNPTFTSGALGVRGRRCADPPEAKSWCGLLTTADIRAAVSLYGGRARKPQVAFCTRPAPDYRPSLDVAYGPAGSGSLILTAGGDPGVAQAIVGWTQPGADCSAAAAGATALTFPGPPSAPGGALTVTPPEGAGCVGVAYLGWDGTPSPPQLILTDVVCTEPQPGQRSCTVTASLP